jgi:hypothetical protein
VLKNVTITLSKLVGEMLERQMRQTDEYWRAFERWKTAGTVRGIGAANRPTRTELHERR